MCGLSGLKFAGCTGETTKSYACAYCCTEEAPQVACCDPCYVNMYQRKGFICQKPGCVEHTEDIKAQRQIAKAAEQQRVAQEKLQAAKEKLGAELRGDLSDVARDFQNSPTATLACSDLQRINEKDVKTLVAAAKAAKWTEANIPGAKADQMFEIFYFAFSRGSKVTLGGSRVRAFHVAQGKGYREGEVPYKETSDLDVGYSRLNAGQAGQCRANATKDGADWLPIEEAMIIPGNTIGGQKIVSPEEFFQRSGERSVDDLKRKNEGIERYYPSGSVTFDLNGNAVANPPA